MAALTDRLQRYSEACVADRLDADFAKAVREAVKYIQELEITSQKLLLANVAMQRPRMAEYIDREAFIAQKRELYCKDCDRRKGMKNGKYRILYDIGDVPCRACGIEDVLSDVEDFPAVDVQPVKWISVTERLPNENGEYLVSGKGKVWVCEFMILGDVGGWCNSAMNPCVKYWMPIPEPSKDGET